MNLYSLPAETIENYLIAIDLLGMDYLEAAKYAFNNRRPTNLTSNISWETIAQKMRKHFYFSKTEEEELVALIQRGTPIMKAIEQVDKKKTLPAKSLVKFVQLKFKSRLTPERYHPKNVEYRNVLKPTVKDRAFGRAIALGFSLDSALDMSHPIIPSWAHSRRAFAEELFNMPHIQAFIAKYKEGLKPFDFKHHKMYAHDNTHRIDGLNKYLSDKGKLFCQLLIDGFNQLEAAVQAGFGSNIESAQSASYLYLLREEVKAYIEHLLYLKIINTNKLKHELGDLY